MTKQYILVILLLFLHSYISFGQTIVCMEEENGTYKIPCLINGARMKMVFDTGASSVSISKSMAEYLYENDYLSNEDFLGKGKSIVADGSIVDNLIINIKDIEISGLHLKNVEATVSSSSNSPLLLGQSAIQQLGSITLQGNKLIINSGISKYTKEQITSMLFEANTYYLNDQYYAASDLYEKLYDQNCLDADELLYLTACYSFSDKPYLCLKRGKEWDSKYGISASRTDKAYMYGMLAHACQDLNDTNNTIMWLEKSNQFEDKYSETYIYNLYLLGTYYYKKKIWIKAESYFENAASKRINYLNKTWDDVSANRVNDEMLGNIFSDMSGLYADWGKYDSSESTLILSAKCGNEFSRDWCSKMGLNYKIIKKR